MSKKYAEYTSLNLPDFAEEVLKKWDTEGIFEKSIAKNQGKASFVFYEGPPSANGLPGIHHVMGRAIKDIFCRYKTLKGYEVKRKAGWDTHGLPVELGVEKALGITKEDIGKSISVEAYNKACKTSVMKYTDVWNDLTKKMGYWVDLSDPYITYKNKYMETVWWLLKRIYDKDLLYKGYSIQPYSPAAGTGLSSNELNMPGCYRDVKDTSAVAQFKLINDTKKEQLFGVEDIYLLAWTTTPWTLPSNTALAVGKKIEYVSVKTYNQYTHLPITLVLAKPLLEKQLSGRYKPVNDELSLADYTANDKVIPYEVVDSFNGQDLVGLRYNQLMPYCLPYENAENAFQVISGDFVTTEDGTGIVHIAPTFGADDAMVAKAANIPAMLVLDEHENPVPLVDLQGRFIAAMGDLAGKYVKNEYYSDGEAPEKSIDVEIAIILKEQNKAFKVEKYEHSYPHCWRTDKPVLYYPLDSWFVKVTQVKNRMAELNRSINWKPKATGEGRFGNWLENANDWNLSRSRFWGIPLPIWRTEDGTEVRCIGSAEELKLACDASVSAGLMDRNPLKDFIPGDFSEENYDTFDLHKNHVDQIILVSESGVPMHRESDLIDVWFDSGSMPYAQLHYPFENKSLVDDGSNFPSDFIAEGVDQTRGWFYTLHAIATMCFDSVAYKNVVSNGLVLDKNGQKMSKRLGNGVDPFELLAQYGPDATRWYMMTNAQPWDNLKFDVDGIIEVQRKFFGTLYNTYGFFALYANVDQFSYAENNISLVERPEIDRWILSKLNTLIKSVGEAYEQYEPTKAGRLIQDFVIDQLSNWYVRLCRRRFWKGDYTNDKIAAYQTLYTCLETVAVLSCPIAPFYSDKLYCDLQQAANKSEAISVHLADFPAFNEAAIDLDLEQRMEIAQKVSSLVLSLRKKERLKVRQPLSTLMVPVLNETFGRQIKDVSALILSEVNVKELKLLTDTTGVLTKKIKPNFKTIGPKYKQHMKAISQMVNGWGAAEITDIEQNNGWNGMIGEDSIVLDLNDLIIETDDIPGWLVQTENGITVALDISLTDELKEEALARELVNRIQNIRKDHDFDLTDKVTIVVKSDNRINDAINNNLNYICSETLADRLSLSDTVDNGVVVNIDEIETEISVEQLK